MVYLSKWHESCIRILLHYNVKGLEKPKTIRLMKDYEY